MPPKTTQEEARLLAAYREAALRLERTLRETNGRNRVVILRRVDAILAELDQLTSAYMGEGVPNQYRRGSEEAIAELHKIRGFGDIEQTFGTLHKQAVENIIREGSLNFANTLAGVRRDAEAMITRAEKASIIAEIAASEIEGADPKQGAKDRLDEAGIVSVRGARTWTLEDYASMLTRTVLAEAHNTGAMTRYLENGVTFGQVIERETACPICGPMRGKIVSLADRRLLPPYHPNAVFAGESFATYGDLKEMVRASYSGPARFIRFGDNQIAIGPNHPMVTKRGLVPAKFLCKGDELLYDTRVNSGRSESAIHAKLNDVPLIEDAFESLASVGCRSLVSATSHDFHGDAEFIQGKIDVVRPHRDLLPVLDASPIKKDLKLPLTRSDSESSFVSGSSTSDQGVETFLLTPSGGLSLPNGMLPSYFVWLPITHIWEGHYTGLAFDASTEQGLYSYGGLVVSNCNGGITPFVGEPENPILTIDDPRIPEKTRKYMLKR